VTVIKKYSMLILVLYSNKYHNICLSKEEKSLYNLFLVVENTINNKNTMKLVDSVALHNIMLYCGIILSYLHIIFPS
jgi:hypothetical protein